MRSHRGKLGMPLIFHLAIISFHKEKIKKERRLENEK